jgi:hypothetical protein
MADSTSELLMAKMRGEASPSRASESPVEPRTREIFNAMRGGSERDFQRERAERNVQWHRAEQAFHARVTKRAKEIAAREDDRFPWERDDHMPLPLDRARAEIQEEDQERAKEAKRREVYDAMVQNTRRGNETLSTENIRKHAEQERAARKKRGEERDRRFIASILAELNKPSA